MPSASSRVRAPRYKTEPLNLQAIPIPQREDGAVATVRILNVGSKTAARSGSTWQIPGPVQPGQPIPDPPHVVYARSAPPRYAGQYGQYEPRARAVAVQEDRGLFDVPRQRIADLQVRAARALSGLSGNMPTQRIEVGTWSKPSTRVMCMAVGVYTLALFLIALLSR